MELNQKLLQNEKLRLFCLDRDNCPDNDCIIFFNTWRMMEDCYTAIINGVPDYAEKVLTNEFNRRARELEDMLLFNYAVRNTIKPIADSYKNSLRGE